MATSRSTRRIVLLITGLVAALTVPAIPVTAASSAATASARTPTSARIMDDSYDCDTSTGGGDFDYDGDPASTTYDRLFHRGPKIPRLGSYVPQGLAWWPERGWFLHTSYRDEGFPEAIVTATTRGGKVVGSAGVYGGHVGGISVGRGHAYVVDSSNGLKVSRYRLGRLAKEIREPGTGYLTYDASRPVKAASFDALHGDTLWVGRFDEDSRDRVYRYDLTKKGLVTERRGSVEAPKKAQGMAVTDNWFFFSTSHDRDNRSNLYVKNRNSSRVRCFRAPSMSQGMVRVGGIYVSYESGAKEYAGDSNKPRNIITHLHWASVNKLTSLQLSS